MKIILDLYFHHADYHIILDVINLTSIITAKNSSWTAETHGIALIFHQRASHPINKIGGL